MNATLYNKKILINSLYGCENDLHITILREKIAKGKGLNNYPESNLRTLITRTNNVIEKKFGTKEFIFNEKDKSGFYRLNSKPKNGVFGM